MDGLPYSIEFFGCNSPITQPFCSTIAFRAVASPACEALSVAKVALLNQRTRCGVYVLATDGSGALLLDMRMIVAGGVHPARLEDHYRLWRNFLAGVPAIEGRLGREGCDKLLAAP